MRAATTAGNRWRIYQRERFPLLTQGPVIAAFSFSAVSFSALLRHRPGPPPAGAVLVAFVTSFVFFPQLRIADEFKDADDDARYRPSPGPPAHPFTLHVDPLVDHPAYRFIRLRLRLACDGSALPHGLHWFLAAGYCNGMVVEIGRKIRAPEDEERGVETYTAVWGRSTAELLPHCPDLTYVSLRDRMAARGPRTPARRSVLGGGASSRYPRAVFPPSERRAVRAPDLTAPFVHHGRPAPDAKEAGNDRAAIRKRSRGL